MKIFTEGSVSAYVIDTFGKTYEFVSPKRRAYHAGVGKISSDSKMNPVSEKIGRNDMNSWSVGIKNVNKENELFSKPQILSNLKLCESLVKEYNMDSKLMLGHSDWSPGRKIDPSVYFPWETFANASKFEALEVDRNFGIYPELDSLDLKSNPEVLFNYRDQRTDSEELESLRNDLRSLGYYINHIKEDGFCSNTSDVMFAFRAHYSNKDILTNQTLAWEELVASNTFENRVNLSSFNENDMMRLNNLLDQLGK